MGIEERAKGFGDEVYVAAIGERKKNMRGLNARSLISSGPGVQRCVCLYSDELFRKRGNH